jgi:hypothetical protein
LQKITIQQRNKYDKDSYNKNKFYSNKPKEIKVKEITLSSTGREGKIYKGKAKDYPGIVKIIKSSTN